MMVTILQWFCKCKILQDIVAKLLTVFALEP